AARARRADRGSRALVRARAGGVRGDDHVRRQPPGRHPNAAARDLRRVRPELRCGSRGERRAHRRQRRSPTNAQNRSLMATVTLEQVTVPLRTFQLCLSLSVDSTVALIGPSGAGKSTVLNAIAGLVKPAAGRIRCDDETWFDAERGVFVPP